MKSDDQMIKWSSTLIISISFSASAELLSLHARVLLQIECESYAKELLNFCQVRFGGVKGACRYAKCLNLMENAFKFKQNYQLLTTYIEVFYNQREFELDHQVPKYLSKLV